MFVAHERDVDGFGYCSNLKHQCCLLRCLSALDDSAACTDRTRRRCVGPLISCHTFSIQDFIALSFSDPTGSIMMRRVTRSELTPLS
jgi:hypothetical protein